MQNNRDDQVLVRLPFLSRLEPCAVAELVGRLFQSRPFEFGETIVAEGEAARRHVRARRGSARVLVDHAGQEITLSRLGPATGSARRRCSTVPIERRRCGRLRRCRLWLDRVVFDSLLQLHPEIRDAFGDQARIELLHRFLRTHAAFEDLSLEAASAMFPILQVLEVAEGAVVVREGEPGVPCSSWSTDASR